MDLAAAEPPAIAAGDLRTELAGVAMRAPMDSTLVVFHTEVLAHLPHGADRDRFATAVVDVQKQRPTIWVANESPRHIPGLDPTVVDRAPTRRLPALRRRPTSRLHRPPRRCHHLAEPIERPIA